MHRRLIVTFSLPLLLLLAACDARQSYPQGYTDIDLWQGPPIRVDTEVPNQYPNGTTREAHAVDAYEGDDAHGGEGRQEGGNVQDDGGGEGH